MRSLTLDDLDWRHMLNLDASVHLHHQRLDSAELFLFEGPIDAQPLSWATKLLDATELHRMSTYRHETDAARFALRRAILRSAIHELTGLAATELRFTHNAWGKPELSCDQWPFPLWFNTSSRGESILVAIDSSRPIGVDIERHTMIADLESLAETSLHPLERELWGTLAESSKQRWYYDLWTRKEAVLKCVGCGLQVEPSTICVVQETAEPIVAEPIVVVHHPIEGAVKTLVRQVHCGQATSAAIAWRVD